MALRYILLCLVLIVAGVSAACSSNADCNENGVCTNGNCQCDYGWSGSACTTLNFKPVAPGGAYGFRPNVTTWGGNPVLVDGTYHLLVTEIINHCGLCTWGSNSHVIHATSNNLLGPYTYQNEALPVWSHNPQIVVDHSSGSPVYLLFHIGTADGGVTPKVCSGQDDKARTRSPYASGVLHSATNPAGPYTPQSPPGLGGCNNPAPYVYPNGTILLVCSQGGTNVWYAENWKGPWSGRSIVYSGNPGVGIWEDPFIWRDKRGVFKMLAHVYPQPNQMPHYWSRVSGFAYSYDGFHWVQQSFQVYTNVVEQTNGTITYTTRERPKLFFDTDGTTPLALFTGVAEGSNCWDCKLQCGVDWTFNLAVAIAP